MAERAKSFWLETLGCKANQYDSQRLGRALTDLGWRPAAGPEGADLILVNTCAVTAEAGRKSRQHLRRALRRGAGTRVVATGCLVAFNRLTGEELPPEVLALAGGAREEEMGELLARLGHPGAGPPATIAAFRGRTRAFLKAQEGCDNHCTYCIIPRLRGPSCSRPLAAILAEAEGLIAGGVPELVLTGVCLGDWREGKSRIPDLVAALAALPGDFRLRLSSLEPEHCDPELLAAMASPKVCPHLHLPLQSGADPVLRRMGRKYVREDFLELVAAARRTLAEPALTTDVILGFPGEEEEHFAQTLEVLARAAPVRTHLFPYSPRRGTAAARLEERVPLPVLRARAEAARRLTGALARAAARERIGRREEVVLEGRNRGWSGRYQRVRVAGPPRPSGWRLAVEITAVAGEELVGRPCGEPGPTGEKPSGDPGPGA